MEYDMQDLVTIVADLARKSCGCDSTSVTYEKAQTLMEAVIYCLNECENANKNELLDTLLSVKEQYRIGAELVEEKAQKVKDIYNDMMSYFDAYGMRCLEETVQKGIPAFLTWYDVRYCPQDTILTLDYPVLVDIHELSGADAIYQYISFINIEQNFLNKFDKQYIHSVLQQALPDYEQMIENICGIILLNTIGHFTIGKTFVQQGFSDEEYETLTRIYTMDSVELIEEYLCQMLEQMVHQLYEDDREMREYFMCHVRNLAVRIDIAVETKTLEKIFIL